MRLEARCPRDRMGMDIRRIETAKGSLRGELTMPGDKSIAHRAVIFASVGEGPSRIFNLSGGEDNLRTVRAFKKLGVKIREEAGTLHVEGEGWEGVSITGEVIDCGNSGTTMRLLSGVLAGRPIVATLDGDASLRQRPMDRIIEPLSRMGAQVISRNQGKAPLRIQGAPLRGIHYRSPVASAQVKSAILLAGLQAEGPTIIEEPQKSRDHTEIMARAFGAKVETEGKVVSIPGHQRLSGTDIRVPGDLSSAAFFLVAAAIVPGSDIVIRDVGCNPTRSGVIEVLKRMGAAIELLNLRQEKGEPVADLRATFHGRLKGVDIGPELVAETIDEYPILTVAAAVAEGTTTISGAEELRYKESDRIATMSEELKKLGVRVEERKDGMTIVGRERLDGGRLKSYGDHRVAMALAVGGFLSREGVEIDDAACANISFPGFFDLLEGLRSA